MGSKEKITIARTIDNIKYILNYFFRYGKKTFGYRFVLLIISVVQVYITVNVASWIISCIVMGKLLVAFICVIAASVFIGLSSLISTRYSLYTDEIIQIEVKKSLYMDLLNSVKKTKQKSFYDNKYYDRYVRSLVDIEVQPERIINTTFRFIDAFFKILTIGAIVNGISPIYVLFYIFSAVWTIFCSDKMNKSDYQEFMENTSNERKMEYSKRLAYNPAFSENLKLERNFLKLISDNYSNSVEDYKGVIKKYRTKKVFFASILQVSNILYTFLLPWLFLAYQYAKGELGIETVMIIVSSMTALPSILNNFLQEYNALRLHSCHVENIRRVLENNTDLESQEGNILKEPIHDIKFSDVEFGYDKAHLILKGINVEAKKGETIAIVGLNGVGKTTFLKLLQRLYHVDSGSIEINGLNIKDVQVDDYRLHLASIQQNFEVYGFSIAENILMKKPETEEDYTKIKEALRKVELLDKVMQLPDGLDSYVTKEFDPGGAYFSGGEIQRLALARLYASAADVVILDEPTSALDAINEEDILNKMSKLFKDKIVFVISHKLSLVKGADRIVVLAKQRIVESGTHSELIKNNGLYSKMYTAQARKYAGATE